MLHHCALCHIDLDGISVRRGGQALLQDCTVGEAAAFMKEKVGCPDPIDVGHERAWPIAVSAQDPYPGRDHLTEGQEVRVKVIGINEAGKVSLSIKKAAAETDEPQDKPQRPAPPRERRSKPNVWAPKKVVPQSEMTFEDMMSHFKQSSEERISDLKRCTDRKNGTRRK